MNLAPPHLKNRPRALNPKTEMDLTADYADYTDTTGYVYQCPEVLPRKDSYVHFPITPSKSVKSA
jgi:hypothetical protein